MSLSMCVLGSGSGGNCTVLLLHDQTEPRTVLIDAGLSPSETAKRLGPLGLDVSQIDEIVVTHPDYDHFHPGWMNGKWRGRFTWRISRRHIARAYAAGLLPRDVDPFDDQFQIGCRTEVTSTALPHDSSAAMGLVFDHGGVRLGYATDLGRVTPALLKAFCDLDALAIESNYDRAMQQASNRPAFLKRRIMGGLGHLSNEQSLEAVVAIARTGSLQHVVLLHLSRQCNDPQLVQRLFAAAAPILMDRLTRSSQFAATPMLLVQGPTGTAPRPVRPGRQLNFLESP